MNQVPREDDTLENHGGVRAGMTLLIIRTHGYGTLSMRCGTSLVSASQYLDAAISIS